MSVEKAKAVNDVCACAMGDDIAALMATIVAALGQADHLNLPFVAIHLDHALALCNERMASEGDAS